jgi:hypothetical protein
MISLFSYECAVFGRPEICGTPWLQGPVVQRILQATVKALAFLFPFPIMQGPPRPLKELEYNQQGLDDLRQHLGVLPRGVYETYRPSFDAADIAWIATTLGLASSTKPIGYNEFPPELEILREGMPIGKLGSTKRASMRSRVQKLVFDVVSVVLLILLLITYVNHLNFSRPLSGTELMVVQLW